MSSAAYTSPDALGNPYDSPEHMHRRAAKSPADPSYASHHNYLANPTTPQQDHQLLSPYSSAYHSKPPSPGALSYTPPETGSTNSVQYQSSDLGEIDFDLMNSIDFGDANINGASLFDTQPENALGGVPSLPDFEFEQYGPANTAAAQFITPDDSPPISSNQAQFGRDLAASFNIPPREAVSVSPQLFTKTLSASPPVPGLERANTAPQLTPDTPSNANPPTFGGQGAMPVQSPRFKLSVWGEHNAQPVHAVERSFNDRRTERRQDDDDDSDNSPASRSPNIVAADTLFSSTGYDFVPNHITRRNTDQFRSRTGGLDPPNRPTDEVTSINQLAANRDAESNKKGVQQWMTGVQGGEPVQDAEPEADLSALSDRPDSIPLGSMTQNKFENGQTYFLPKSGGEITDADRQMMSARGPWTDAPIVHPITEPEDTVRQQPETSDAAMRRFDEMVQETGSVLSRQATWGTRRRSLPSIHDIEGVTSGNFLKRLTVKEPKKEKVSLLQNLLRKSSATGLASQLKRRTSGGIGEDEPGMGSRKDSTNSLRPPSRTSSWNKKSPPSINTALVSMGMGGAAIGSTTHARSGSIGAGAPLSPMASLGASTLKKLTRPRSKSDIPQKPGMTSSHSNLADLWKSQGGPPISAFVRPVAVPNKPVANVEPDDDEDDDDDVGDESELKTHPVAMIEGFQPTREGFQKHIIALNPWLADNNQWLVQRIAHAQIIRYKHLLIMKAAHANHVHKRDCPNAASGMCIMQGGTVKLINAGHAPTVPSPIDFPEDDSGPPDGAVTKDSFPRDIPMPPAPALPAEFECQLCFAIKKFQKPSDWTKHVHEDVQPFTCTWETCKDTKVFKRKADWVRHENEGHRQLEWWKCNVDDCTHVCYRRDNFLQHLVREHKFPEPKVKTKAQIKKAQQPDQTWQRVDMCHVDTPKHPQDERCRFCNRSFPTWKKLTVHLAKHMEHISLPVLQWVEAKEVEHDTLISPVPDPPPRAQPFARQHVDLPLHTLGIAQPGLSVGLGPHSMGAPGPAVYTTAAADPFATGAYQMPMAPAQFEQQYFQAAYPPAMGVIHPQMPQQPPPPPPPQMPTSRGLSPQQLPQQMQHHQVSPHMSPLPPQLSRGMAGPVDMPLNPAAYGVNQVFQTVPMSMGGGSNYGAGPAPAPAFLGAETYGDLGGTNGLGVQGINYNILGQAAGRVDQQQQQQQLQQHQQQHQVFGTPHSHGSVSPYSRSPGQAPGSFY